MNSQAWDFSCSVSVFFQFILSAQFIVRAN